MKKYFGLIALAALLVGCDSTAEQDFDVAYYVSHEKERTLKLNWCKENIERRTQTNCINAQNAKSKLATKKMLNEGITIPKLDLN